MSKLVLFSCLLIATLSLVDSAGEKSSVSVYYESLCPDSIKFITTQLYPTYTSPLKRFFQLNLIPYGKSSQTRQENGQWSFTCHHGPNECYGNKVHACVLKYVPEEADKMKWINCLLSLALNDKNVFPVNKCASDIQADPTAIVNCANSTEGSNLLTEFGHATQALDPQLTSVPTIVFNKNFSKKDQDLSLQNFRAALCSYIKEEDTPHECKGVKPNSATKLSMSGLALVMLVSMALL